MKSGATLSEWLAWQETLAPNEINLGLQRVNEMLARLALAMPNKILLIAGTNGKGSSVAMAAALLRSAKLKVGSYTSPHIENYNERIVVNGEAAPDKAIVNAFERIEQLRDDVPLTYFEFGTLAAFVVFAAAQLDVWVLEVGLGGRLDATNAIQPSASLITNISLDHCDWLGDNVDAIATEKAGVMRAATVTVIGDADAPAILDTQAQELGAIGVRAGRDFQVARSSDGRWNWRGQQFAIDNLRAPGLSGDFQIDNAAAVLALLSEVGFSALLTRERINAVLPNLRLAGRTQQQRVRGRRWLLDVAHNPAAAKALAVTLSHDATQQPAKNRDIVAIIGVLADKDAEGILRPLLPLVSRWIAVTPDNPRALPANELARVTANLSGQPCLIGEDFDDALEIAGREAGENARILVTGSFFTVGPALRYLQSDSIVDA